jgi:hypothetical protein
LPGEPCSASVMHLHTTSAVTLSQCAPQTRFRWRLVIEVPERLGNGVPTPTIFRGTPVVVADRCTPRGRGGATTVAGGGSWASAAQCDVLHSQADHPCSWARVLPHWCRRQGECRRLDFVPGTCPPLLPAGCFWRLQRHLPAEAMTATQAWFASMPRPERLLPQKRPATALQVAGVAGASGGVAGMRGLAKTIDRYYLSRHCAVGITLSSAYFGHCLLLNILAASVCWNEGHCGDCWALPFCKCACSNFPKRFKVCGAYRCVTG